MALGGLGGRLLALVNLRRVFSPAWRLEPLAGASGPGLPAVSICIPARDEALVIDRLLDSTDRQDLPGIEVVLIDDRSSDGTGDRAREHHTNVVEGTEPPEGWLGKCWALHQAQLASKGEILLFVDADTWHHPAAARTVAAEMDRRELDALVVIGGQHLGSWGERLVQPFLWTLLLSLLNPARAEDPRFPDDAMGNGQFAAFRRVAYLAGGGHEAVKDRIVEDVALARNIKRAGGKFSFRMGPRITTTRMYDGLGALWKGFAKNAAVVDPDRPLLSTMLTLIAVAFIIQAELWPWMVLTWGLVASGLGQPAFAVIASMATLQLAAIFAGRFLLYREVCDEASGAKLSRHPLCYVGQPVGAVIGLAAMLNSLITQLRGKTFWKGRSVRARSL